LRILSSASAACTARQKQILLECILKDPKRSWLKYMDNRQTLSACVRLYLAKLSFTCNSRQRV
jgi:hypothetical protein